MGECCEDESDFCSEFASSYVALTSVQSSCANDDFCSCHAFPQDAMA